MIEKEPGNHRIHRLRIIHLYEADLGACYAILWKKLFANAKSDHAINSGSFAIKRGNSIKQEPSNDLKAKYRNG
jgi:hypothetical protein